MGHLLERLLVSLMLAVGVTGAAVAADFPSKPVRLVVPWPPGGGLDIEARLIAAKMSGFWSQPIVVENRPGGTSIIGVDNVAKSAPDGHSLVINSNLIVITPWLKKTPWDVIGDLVGVVQTSNITFIMATSLKSGASSIDKLVELAKNNPGKLNYASTGVGSSAHLYGELLMGATKISMTQVPYKGEALALQALLVGEVDLLFGTTPTVRPFAKAGDKLHALMVTGANRIRDLPNIPPMETVYPGVSIDGWYGIFAPAATPREIVNRLSADLRKAILSPDIVNLFREKGIEPSGAAAEQFGATVRRDYERWGKVIRDNNIRAD